MHLRISCPHCGNPIRLSEPFPVPGTERQCVCGRALAITYPLGMMDRLKARGARFADDEAPEPPAARTFLPPTAPDEDRPTVAIPGRQTVRIEDEAPPAPRPPADKTVAIHARPPRPLPDARPQGEPEARVPWAPADAPAPTHTRRWKKFAIGLGVLGLLGIAAGAGLLAWVGRDLPSVEQLGDYKPPTVTVVYDAHGELMGEIYDKRRYVVELDRVPKHVQDAFLSAEDAGFREHGGVDYMGIVRAVLRNAAQGRKAQGASTITQQVARNFLLTNEKTYTRKLREVVLAWRIEDAFDKDHILYLYLNEIYLGSGAYGVEAAARTYFGKHVEQLSLAEGALLAGLPQRPSDYSPHRDLNAAKVRQKYVLEQMVDNGLLTDDQADKAYKEPILLVHRTNEFLLKAPWFTEQVRQQIVAKYGEDAVLNQGLVVETSCDLKLQQEAQRVVTEHVTALDTARGGWRGAKETLAEADIPTRLEALSEPNSDLTEQRRYDAVVLEVTPQHAIVGLTPQLRGIVPLAWTTWARPKGTPGKLADLTKVLQRGDVVTVEVANLDFREAEPLRTYKAAGEGPFAAVTLYQPSEVQGALYSYRLSDGAVVAMVGGSDFKETEFNRAVQASRQVGSTFKPIVYAAAIESRKFTAGTIVQDAPVVFNTMQQQLWKPENFGEDYMGDISLRTALAMSRNVVTIRVLDAIGLDPVYQLARRLGIESPMEVDLSMGLGAASLKMPELARAYSVFATRGHKVEPHLVNRVLDRNGKVLEAFTPPEAWEQVLDPSVAGITSWLLEEVVRSGTATKATALGIPVAGKTGTTNEFRDAWFVGYTPELLTAAWIGYDQPRSLGGQSTGGQVTLPMWMEYTAMAAPKPQKPFAPIPGVTWMSVDEHTGWPVVGGRALPFLAGTAPQGVALQAGQVSTEDLKTTEF